MSVINTRDTIGDAATVDGLVEHSLTELVDDSIAIIEDYACYYNNGLEAITFPNVYSIEEYAFANDTSLTVAELGSINSETAISIKDSAFMATNLTHLIINNSSVAIIPAASNVLYNTPIFDLEGFIYVPSDKVSSYKSATNWCIYNIYPLSEYPKQSIETITDSWATILADTDPSSHYSIGDVKFLSINNNNVAMQIVGFNCDTIASDPTKKARITWMTKHIYDYEKSKYQFNDTNSTTGGWASCSLRTELINDILPYLEASDVGLELQTVNKSYKATYGAEDSISEDKIWVPSMREIYNGLDNNKESTGPQYATSGRFHYQKHAYDSRTTLDWWTRTLKDATKYTYASVNTGNGSSPNGTRGLVFGFCTGIHPIDTISDSWSTILADSDPSSHYSIGDTKAIVLDGKVCIFEIVAFNADVLASDSSKTALITWLIQRPYGAHAFNSTATTSGGWEGSELRTWLISDVLPLLEASDIGPYLQTVTKTYRTKHTNDGDTTKSCSDKIWVPSCREINDTTALYMESSGPIYSQRFLSGNTSAATSSRYKYDDSDTRVGWGLRTVADGNRRRFIANSGSFGNSSATEASNVVFGFCTSASS